MSKPPTPRRTTLQKLGLGVFLVVLAGLPVMAYFTSDHPWILMVLAFFYIVTAFVLQSRLIACVLMGIGLSLLFDSGVQQSEPLMRLWILIWQLAVGVLVGILAGLIWERTQTEGENATPPDREEKR
jgi:uncharacterized membrane protein YccC